MSVPVISLRSELIGGTNCRSVRSGRRRASATALYRISSSRLRGFLPFQRHHQRCITSSLLSTHDEGEVTVHLSVTDSSSVLFNEQPLKRLDTTYGTRGYSCCIQGVNRHMCRVYNYS